jgi:hypothetical protein
VFSILVEFRKPNRYQRGDIGPLRMTALHRLVKPLRINYLATLSLYCGLRAVWKVNRSAS